MTKYAPMRLYWSPASPYARKVMACAVARGLDGRIETEATNPHISPAGLVADNPLSKVPCLISDEGVALFDSPVICEYLDSLGDAPRLFPASGLARWRALRLQALADGIMDAAVARRMEGQKPQDDGRQAFDARQKAAIDRAVSVLETEADALGTAAEPTIGTVAAGCALGYLDFRFAHEPWRPAAPRLAAWFAALLAWPAMARTAPA
jgi:glutathione S-transferase